MAVTDRKLRSSDDRSAFESGDADLDHFFKRFADPSRLPCSLKLGRSQGRLRTSRTNSAASLASMDRWHLTFLRTCLGRMVHSWRSERRRRPGRAVVPFRPAAFSARPREAQDKGGSLV